MQLKYLIPVCARTLHGVECYIIYSTRRVSFPTTIKDTILFIMVFWLVQYVFSERKKNCSPLGTKMNFFFNLEMLDMKKKYSLAHGKKLSHTFKLFFFSVVVVSF